jgi:hypothetical protein
MITIPTIELIGGIQDMLPIVLDDKSDLAGLAIEWDGESLHFTAYDVFAAATVQWTPGEGAEGDLDEDAERDDVRWGGDDSPWRTWIYLDAAKEIVKLFKLPAKLWRTPVTLKCTPVGDLLIERIDSPRDNRELRVPGDPDKARRDIRPSRRSGTRRAPASADSPMRSASSRAPRRVRCRSRTRNADHDVRRRRQPGRHRDGQPVRGLHLPDRHEERPPVQLPARRCGRGGQPWLTRRRSPASTSGTC